MMISRMALCVNSFFEIFFGHAPSVMKVQKVQRGKVLRIDRPDGRRILKFDGLSGRGLWYRPAGDEYKVSVTDSPFCVIWHDKHYADWLAALASPLSGCAGLPPVQGEE